MDGRIDGCWATQAVVTDGNEEDVVKDVVAVGRMPGSAVVVEEDDQKAEDVKDGQFNDSSSCSSAVKGESQTVRGCPGPSEPHWEVPQWGRH